MQIVTRFPHEIDETADMGITLGDGCRLSARVWMPADAAADPVPAIVEYIPYRKRDGTVARDERMHPFFAGHGYAALRVDMRGNGDSQGLMADEYTERELADACEAIDWIAAQPWCDGNVGMMGKSWGGFNCLQVAALRPPALRAVITVCSTTDRFADDIHYKGGALLLDNFSWGSTMLAYSSRPPDPALVGDAWRDMWRERLEHEPFLTPLWLAHQRRDAYWRHGSVCEDYGAIEVPVLAIGGWADNYMNTVAHLVENLSVPAKGIIGPWVHQYPHEADPSPQIGFLQEALRWWDRWLCGTQTGVEDDPALRVWMQESVRPSRMRPERPGRWVAEHSWPSGRQRAHHLFLCENGALLPARQRIDVRVDSPLDCGFGAGSYFPMSGALPQMPGDQRDDDARSATFDTAPLGHDLEILGRPEVRLRLRCNRARAQIAVRLSEVHPDGASNRLTWGVLNLCHRNGHDAPLDVPTDRAFEVSLPLDLIACRIRAGMVLRVAVSTACWPFLWPAPERAALTIEEGSIVLPEHDGPAEDEWRFEPPASAPGWAHDVLRPPLYEARRDDDLATGEVTLSITDDSGLARDRAHGLATGSVMRYRRMIHPDDPLSARAETHWTQELYRGDWTVRTDTYASMWADRTTYYLTGRIAAREGDRLIFERDFEERVARDFT